MNNPPQQWHLYIVDLEPRIGTKPGKQRPCLAIQPSEFAKAELPSTVVLPLTTQLTVGNTYPLRVRIPKGICALKKTSEVLIDQILAWDNQLFRDDLGLLPDEFQILIKRALSELLDL
jgi:mRNA interferase MazF